MIYRDKILSMEKEKRIDVQFTTNIFVYTPESWAKIADEIALIDSTAFGGGVPLERVRDNFSHPNFEDPSLLTVLLYSKLGLVIGYSQAEQSWTKVSARIVRTAIAPEYRGRGLVGNLMNRMETELKSRGVTTLNRKVRTEGGYADAIRRHYKDKIIADYTDDIHPMTERLFVIKL